MGQPAAAGSCLRKALCPLPREVTGPWQPPAHSITWEGFHCQTGPGWGSFCRSSRSSTMQTAVPTHTLFGDPPALSSRPFHTCTTFSYPWRHQSCGSLYLEATSVCHVEGKKQWHQQIGRNGIFFSSKRSCCQRGHGYFIWHFLFPCLLSAGSRSICWSFCSSLLLFLALPLKKNEILFIWKCKSKTGIICITCSSPPDGLWYNWWLLPSVHSLFQGTSSENHHSHGHNFPLQLPWHLYFRRDAEFRSDLLQLWKAKRG